MRLATWSRNLWGWNSSRILFLAMHKTVELLIGRLATDSKLRRRFAASPEAVLRELVESGLELTEIELAALAATPPEALRSLAATLDARLRRYEPGLTPSSLTPSPNPLNPADPTQQETPQ